MSKIYFDMDGVLANFDKAMAQMLKKAYWDRSTDEHWSIMEEQDGFFDRLEPLPSAFEMVNFVIEQRGLENVEILTALPNPTGKLANAKQHKIDWAHEYINDKIVVNTIIGGKNKVLWLKDNPNAVLVDDYDRNIKMWNANGGRGILHTDPYSTLEKLRILGEIEYEQVGLSIRHTEKYRK